MTKLYYEPNINEFRIVSRYFKDDWLVETPNRFHVCGDYTHNFLINNWILIDNNLKLTKEQ